MKSLYKISEGCSTIHSTHLANEDLANYHSPDSSSREDPELHKRLAIIEQLEKWLQAVPIVRFIDPRETTVSYRWFNRLISLKWNANEEKPTEL
jgi:hypothetical protein